MRNSKGQFIKGNKSPIAKGQKRPEISGSNHYYWKGGWKNNLPNCFECGQRLSCMSAKYCKLHKGKHPSMRMIDRKKTDEMIENIKRGIKLKFPNGRPHTEEWKQKMKGKIPPNKGKRMSDEFRKKCSLSHKGQIPWNKGLKAKNTPSIRSGNRINTWKGGITPEREKIRNSFELKEWRKNVLKRDRFTCKMPSCGQVGGNLEVHHIKKFSKYPELRYEINNGITLCKKCHKSIHWQEEQFEKIFMSILNI